MRAKKRKTIFLCEISNSFIKVIKCAKEARGGKRFIDLDIKSITASLTTVELSEKIKMCFKKLGFQHEPIILSLPSNNVTCRYLKIPTQDPIEIQKIISLQSSTYLPYASHELVTAYEVVSADKQGYAYINTIIAPSELIAKHLKIFDEIRTSSLTVVLSAYGVAYFFESLKSQETDPFMAIDVDREQVEVVIVANHKLFLSRYFRLPSDDTTVENLFAEEIIKTQKTYFEEISKEPVRKAFVFCPGKSCRNIFERLSARIGVSFEVLSYNKNILDQAGIDRLNQSECSFSSLIGLGIKETINESLNLIPQDLKENKKFESRFKDLLRVGGFVFFIFFIVILSFSKSLDNKTRYLEILRSELKMRELEAGPLEEIDRRLRFIEDSSGHRSFVADILYALHQEMPSGTTLDSMIYEKSKKVTLRGQAKELKQVFNLVSILERSPQFKTFEIKIKQTSRRTTLSENTVLFEIECNKKQ